MRHFIPALFFICGISVGVLFFITSIRPALILKQKRQNHPLIKVIPSLTPTPQTAQTCTAISIVSPQPNDTVTFPLAVLVIVNNTNKACHWTTFEAQAGKMEIVDSNGQTVGTGILKTNDDWTQSLVQYAGTVSLLKTPATSDIHLVMSEENPSGKDNPQTFTIPLTYQQ